MRRLFSIILIFLIFFLSSPAKVYAAAEETSYCDPNEIYIDAFEMLWDNVAQSGWYSVPYTDSSEVEYRYELTIVGNYTRQLTFKGEFSEEILNPEDYIISFLFEFEGEDPEDYTHVTEEYNVLVNVGENYSHFNLPYPELIHESDIKKFSTTFYYPELLEKIQIYKDGYDVVLKHIGIRVTNIKAFTYGYTSQVDLNYLDGAYSSPSTTANSPIVSRITYSMLDSLNDNILFSDSRYSQTANGIYMYDQDGGFLDSYVQAGDSVKNVFLTFITKVPAMAKDIAVNTVIFVVKLPDYLSKILVFLPEELIYGIVYIIYFGLLVGIVKFVKEIIT